MLRNSVLRCFFILTIAAYCVLLVFAEEKNKSDKKQVCYDIVGCFSTDEPWQSVTRPCADPPNPKVAKTKILFYSKPFPKRKHIIYKYPKISVHKIPFRRHHPTYVIIHGNNAAGKDHWIHVIKDALIKQKHANVIIPDWEFIAKTGFPINEPVVCGNVRTVAAEVSAVLRTLEREHGLDLANTNCIGHSFGAHVCGYIGKNASGALDTITALDACQPSFEGYPEQVRLVKGDAKFVLAIHTDAAPFALTGAVGFMEPYADTDVYFNGGYGQPGCLVPNKLPSIKKPTDLIKVATQRILGAVSCPHARAYEYFAEAVSSNNCTFWGYRADVKNILEAAANSLTGGKTEELTGNNLKCDKPEDCVPINLDTNKAKGRGVFTAITRAESPFCADKDKAQNITDSKGGNIFSKALKFVKDLI